MGLFDDTTSQPQLLLMKQVFDSQFAGIVLIIQKPDEDNINRHIITFANRAFAEKVGVFPSVLIGQEIHNFVPPSFREFHREILTRFFNNPYRVAIDQRVENKKDMKVVPFNTDDKSDLWHDARIGINPLFAENISSLLQVDDIKSPTIIGMAEIFFAKTFN